MQYVNANVAKIALKHIDNPDIIKYVWRFIIFFINSVINPPIITPNNPLQTSCVDCWDFKPINIEL